jgi:two-component system, chemotaxis family, CheB/CheR fusion protein
VVNVLTNAAKYTPAGGSIWVTVTADSEAIVRVRDSGQGIGPDLLPNVFDLFRQGEHTLEDARGGLGIGLTPVKRILQPHRGTVEAFSRGLDQGQ